VARAAELKKIRRLRRAELPVDTLEMARYLIGKTLVHEVPGGRMSGRIVEVEAYPLGDAAAHHFRGETPRNRSLFLRRGHAYVYFIYGSTFMLNVSSDEPGIGGGILFRAIEPLEGVELMKHPRNLKRPVDLTRGPGRLATALHIDRRFDGLDMCAPGPLWLGTPARAEGSVGESIRIGIGDFLSAAIRMSAARSACSRQRRSGWTTSPRFFVMLRKSNARCDWGGLRAGRRYGQR
jgi:DNA-3-methyladenine glycosylase